jgi:hypothetical protein
MEFILIYNSKSIMVKFSCGNHLDDPDDADPFDLIFSQVLVFWYYLKTPLKR